MLEPFVNFLIPQYNKGKKIRVPGILMSSYSFLLRISCSNPMGCTAVPLQLYHLHLCLYFVFLCFVGLSLSTSTAESLSFTTCLEHHLLCEAILDHFSQRSVFWTFRAIYSHFFITQMSGLSYIWARQWTYSFICYFLSPHKVLSPLQKWGNQNSQKLSVFPSSLCQEVNLKTGL